MMIIHLVRFFLGYVRFRVSGVFIERFLNLVSAKGIHLWGGIRKETDYSGYVLRSQYGLLHPIARKTGLHMQIEEKFGFPVWKKKHKGRIGFAIGMLIFLLILHLMGSFVWTVQVQGNEQITEQEILSCMEDLGLKPGILRAKVKPRELERAALLQLKDLSWIAVNMIGSHVTVEVSERVKAPEMFLDSDMACNIVANAAGQIVSIRIYDGQSDRKVGDVVAKGDLLISGIMETQSGKTYFVHSHGEILAQTYPQKTVSVPLKQTVRKNTGEIKKRKRIRFLMWDIPWFQRENLDLFESTTTITPVAIFGISTPFSVLEETRVYYTEETVQLIEKQAKEQAMEQLLQWEKDYFASAKIMHRSVEGTLAENIYTLSADYTCIMDIGKEQIIEIEREEGAR